MANKTPVEVAADAVVHTSEQERLAQESLDKITEQAAAIIEANEAKLASAQFILEEERGRREAAEAELAYQQQQVAENGGDMSAPVGVQSFNPTIVVTEN